MIGPDLITRNKEKAGDSAGELTIESRYAFGTEGGSL